MAKNIKRKGYIEFEDGIKSDIVAYRECDCGTEIVTTDGLYLFVEDSELRNIYYDLKKPIKIRIATNHLYKLYFRSWYGYDGMTTEHTEVYFKQIVLFCKK